MSSQPPVLRFVSRWRTLIALGTGLLCSEGLSAGPAKEYDLKAAFLYNFATFTEWPTEAFATPDSPFVIGIVGDDPFGRILDKIVSGEQIGGHPMVVERYKRPEEIRPCHILFVSDSESRRVADILRKIRGRPVLTVGDSPEFAEAGGGIGFTTTTNIQLNINPASIQGAKLNISSKLLRLAKLVTPATLPR